MTPSRRGAHAMGPRADLANPELEVAGGLPRNYLRPCLLLLLAEAPAHGYDLLERLRALGLEHPDPGRLYRSLRAMERERLVTSCWEHSESGPARRRYRLTEEGRRWLQAWAEALRDVHLMLGGYLCRYESLANKPARHW